MKKLSIVFLAVLAVAAVASSRSVTTLFDTVRVTASGTSFSQVGISGQGDFGMCVDISQTSTPTAPISVTLDYRYANAPADFHNSPSSVAGTTFTTSMTFTSARASSDFYPAPTEHMNVTATNNSTRTADITVKMFHPAP